MKPSLFAPRAFLDEALGPPRDIQSAATSRASSRSVNAVGQYYAGLYDGAAGYHKVDRGLRVRRGAPQGVIDSVAEEVLAEDVFGHDTSNVRERRRRRLEAYEVGSAAGRRMEQGAVSVSPRRERHPCPPSVVNAVRESDVDAIVLGHDIDRSVDRTQSRLAAMEVDRAAGRRVGQVGIAHTPRRERRACPPSVLDAVRESDIDAVILGHDIDRSDYKTRARLAAIDTESSAGVGHPSSQSRGRRNCPPAVLNSVQESQTAAMLPGRDLSTKRMKSRLDACEVESAAGKLDRSPGREGKKIVSGRQPSTLDEIVWGHDIDKSNGKSHLEAPEYHGAAGWRAKGLA